MFGHGPPRPLLPTRLVEILESAKQEVEQLVQELAMYKRQKDELEHKLNAHFQESQQIQQQIFDLDRTHKKMKQQYEEEIHRLRRQLESTGGENMNRGSSMQSYSPLGSPSSPPPLTSNANSKKTKMMMDPQLVGMPPLTVVGTKRTRPDGQGIVPAMNPGGGPPTPTMGGVPPGVGSLGSVSGLSALGQVAGQSPLPASSSVGRLGPSAFGRANSVQNLPPIGALPPSQPKPKKQTEPQNHPNNKMMYEEQKSEPPRPSPKRLPEVDVEGNDWVVCYNPSVKKRLGVDLAHTLDHTSVVCCVKFSTDGKYLATGCNRSAQIYDVETGVKAFTFTDANAKMGDLYIRSVCFSPDSKFLVTGAEDKTVKVWDIEQKRIKHTLEGHELDIYSLDFSKDGRFVVSGSGDKKVKIWDIETGKCNFTLGNEEVGPKDGVTSVSISPDGRLVSAGSLDRIVRLWDARSGFFLDRFEGHSDSVYSVAFSPEGKSLASGSLDKSVKIWDLGGRARSRCKNTLTGHKDFVLSVAYSPDGKWLVSGSKDRSLQFWDPRSGVAHMMLHGHTNSVISVALSGNSKNGSGKYATGSGDFRARIWNYKYLEDPRNGD